jgi:hypothetical protein
VSKARAGSLSSRTSSNPSPKSQLSTAEVKLRPGSSTNRGGGPNNRNSTLQEDLMRLINPDYALLPSLEPLGRSGSPSSSKSSGSLSLKSSRSVSCMSTESGQGEGGVRAQHQPEPLLPLMPDSPNLDWSTLVDTATKAFQTCEIHLDQGTKHNEQTQSTNSSNPGGASVSLNSSPSRGGGSRTSSNGTFLSWIEENKTDFRPNLSM